MNEQTYDTVDTIDSGVSEEAFLDPVLAQYRNQDEAQHWQDELIAARKEREKFYKRGVDTIKRYADDRENSLMSVGSQTSNFNVFFANTEIKMASLYARTPSPDLKRRFNDEGDQVSRVAANILQRNIVYELECEGFDPKFKQMLFDRLVPGVGVGWARLDQEYEPETYDAMTGALLPPQVKYQLADIDYVAWDDLYWAPCRTWTDCRWVARRIPMSKPAIKTRFAETADPSILANITFSLPSQSAPTDSKDSMRPKNMTQATVDVFEIWDKERRLIFWVIEGVEEPLDVQMDTNEFPGFFPTPLPPMCRTTTSSTMPISDFSLVQDLYNELDGLNNRASKLVRALQLKWLYDAKNPNLKDLYTTTGELEGVGVKDWQIFQAENGGLRGAVEFVDLSKTAEAYTQLIQARDLVKQQIYEIEGISDFLRGVQQPYVSASAANATSSASASRLTVMQTEIADYIQRLLRLKAHLICKFYTPQTLMERAGMLSQADMPVVPQALQLLANEQMRQLRLEVSVDSIQQANWNQDKGDRNELAHSITALMSQILPASQQTPEILPMGIELMKFMVAGYKGAKDFEGTLDNAMQQLTAASAQKQQQPPQPTPEQLKAQTAQQQIAANAQADQAKNETALQIAQMNAQLKAQDQQFKAQDLQIRALQAQTQAKVADASIDRDRAHTQFAVVEGAHQQAMDRITPMLQPGAV